MVITRDYHIHTKYSWCGHPSNTPHSILDKLTNLSYASVGFSDHLHPKTDRRIFQLVKEQVRIWNEGRFPSLQVLIGCEADVLDKDLLTLDPCFAATLDYVLLAPNHYHLSWVKKPPCGTASREQCLNHLLTTHLSAVCPLADIIAHPFSYGCPRMAELSEYIDSDILLPFIQRAKANKVAVEISPTTVQNEHRDFMYRFYVMCLENGVLLCPGSDAHCLEDVGRMQSVMLFLDQLGAGSEDLLELSDLNERS